MEERLRDVRLFTMLVGCAEVSLLTGSIGCEIRLLTDLLARAEWMTEGECVYPTPLPNDQLR